MIYFLGFVPIMIIWTVILYAFLFQFYIKLRNKKYKKYNLTINLIQSYYHQKFRRNIYSYHIDPAPNLFLNKDRALKLQELGYVEVKDTILPEYKHCKIIKELPEEIAVTFDQNLKNLLNSIPKDDQWHKIKLKNYKLIYDLYKIDAVMIVGNEYLAKNNSHVHYTFKPDYILKEFLTKNKKHNIIDFMKNLKYTLKS